MTDEEHQQQQDEYHQQVIASAEHERDLRREDFKPPYPVLCWICHRIMRYSQWPGMVSRHPECK